MKHPDELPSLKVLENRIHAAKEQNAPRKPSPQGVGPVYQIGLELVSGVCVGSFIGYTLDKWLGTSPVFFLVCFFLGAAGGTLTLWRTAKALSKPAETTDDTEKGE